MALDALREEVQGGGGEGRLVGGDRAQRRGGEGRVGVVVVADHRDVLRDPSASPAQRREHADRQVVVAADDPVHLRRTVQQGVRTVEAVLTMPVVHRLDLCIPGLQAVLGKRAEEAVAAHRAGAVGLQAQRRVDRADEGQASTPGLDQVRGRLEGGPHVVDPHVVAALRELLGQVLADEHGGLAGALHPSELLLLEHQRVEDHPVTEHPVEALEHVPLGLGAARGGVEHDGLAAALRFVDELLGEVGEVGEAQRGHREGDHLRGARAQVLSGDLGAVAHLQDRLAHLLAGRVAHVRVVVDHVRDGLDRHARQLGDIAQRGRALTAGGRASGHGSILAPSPGRAGREPSHANPLTERHRCGRLIPTL